MPRSISVDGLELLQIRLLRDPDGKLRVYAEYELRSGPRLVQAKHEDLTPSLSAAQLAAAEATLAAALQQLTAVELA